MTVPYYVPIMCAVSAASQSSEENTSKFRLSTGCIFDR